MHTETQLDELNGAMLYLGVKLHFQLWEDKKSVLKNWYLGL